ncbi:MmgE/PrpD family protein [Sphingomonas sp. TREG-RG-20F-R18-01]|uniref:MmgE/PrpD family protein n=1 Tax=Sphingomonas sp. TREG-RG-20F-R18-01 TaxID=2914982 RepID=UPI001F57C74F|nr:MmgE/PrpD family protein [Sphingomonas sp. TREG-RG-20F-R18-01]
MTNIVQERLENPTYAEADGDSATRLAARRLHEIAVVELPSNVLDAATTCLLDFFAACIGGLSTPWAPAVLQYVAGRAGAGQAHQWGSPVAVPAEIAAFGNATLGHSLISDDMHVMSASHIGVPVIPAALALAERDGWSGRALLRAIVGGYEMATRLGVAIRTGGGNDHFRPSGINGPFGAAAAGIAGVDLDEETAANALGFAANAAAGVNEWPWAGGQEIYTHAGMAARNGVAAFDLARCGLRASASVLEGRNGVFAAYGAGEAGTQAFISSLSNGYAILKTRHKPFAGCNLIQSPLAAALKAAREIAGRQHEIQEIVIRTFAQARSYPGCDNTGPFTQVQQSKMSLQYGVASALLYGRVDEATYACFEDPQLLELIARTRIEVVPEYQAYLQKLMQPACVEVWLREGETIVASVDDVPWLSDEAVEERFRRQAPPFLSLTDANRVVEHIHALWASDTCTPLFELFAETRSNNQQR